MAIQQWRRQFDQIIEGSQAFRDASLSVSRSLHEQVLKQGTDGREAADILHGKIIGHPLHPILTDITVSAWMLGTVFDVLALFSGSRAARQSGNNLKALGTASAVPTALAGITDYSTIKQDAATYGAAHGLLNGMAFTCYLLSTLAGWRGKTQTKLIFSLLGMGFATFSAWLGGDLVYRHRVGVNHTIETGPESWTAVLAADALKDGDIQRVEVEDAAILLYRDQGQIYAINAVCNHAGGPLDEGEFFKKHCIECPWHQSVFDLRDGQVVHGPATLNQPRYEVAVRDNQIEIRRWQESAQSE
jgi:nitrite reductase/ring-hydroxylating ferredoxin subunit/uncharacterized membrane protein